MSDKACFTRKLSAFLHDPIDKPFILMQGGSHEELARYLADLLQVSLEEADGSDWIASAMERVLLPKKSSTKEDLQVRFLDDPEIKHPLSGKNLDCDSIKAFPVGEIKAVVEKTVPEMALHDTEKQFLTLWRNCLANLSQSSPSVLRKYWPVIPADTRIPDHSLFEHLRVTSACFNAMADRETNVLRHNLAFLLCTIGPVQSFIATARKLQDLWMGSFILSYLVWSGMKVVVEAYGPDAIIFPDLYKQPLVDHWLETKKGIAPIGHKKEDLSLPSFPNRFLAIVPGDDVSGLGQTVEQEIRRSFATIGLEAVHRLKLKSRGQLSGMEIDAPLFNNQLNRFLNVYWVAVPWPQSRNGKFDWQAAMDTLSDYFVPEYAQNFKTALEFFATKGEYPPNIGSVYPLLHAFTEKAMGARKSTRDFEQVCEKGQKCSLCGERRAFKEVSGAIRNYRKGLMGEKEFLCAVCLAKRLGHYAFEEFFTDYVETDSPSIATDFPSIAEVAVSDFKIRLLEKAPAEFKRYVEDCRSVFGKDTAHFEHFLPHLQARPGDLPQNVGGEFFIKDFLTEKNLKQALGLSANGYLPDDKANQLKDLRGTLDNLIKKTFSPTPYYAVIMLDGDNMGRWLAGDLAPLIEQIFHSRIWQNLPEKYKQELKEVCRGGQRPVSPAIHAAISAALRNYSLGLVRRIVEEDHIGKLVYAGGDDVLALVNLRDLFDIMVKLRAAFSGHIDRNIDVDFRREVSGFVDMGEELIMTMGPKATASMGVVIAHYKTPFSFVLDKTRDMEKKAKNVTGKDAFAVSLMKHSGEVQECSAKWKYAKNQPRGTIATMEDLARLIRGGFISNKFIYSLQNEFARLADRDGIINVNSQILTTEILRLLLRSKKTKDESIERDIRSLAHRLYGLFANLDGSAANFFGLLQTSNFLAREVREYDQNRTD